MEILKENVKSKRCNSDAKPRKGQHVYATAEHMTKAEGDFVGVVFSVAGQLCHIKTLSNEEDVFIWKFKDGLNSWLNWADKSQACGGATWKS